MALRTVTVEPNPCCTGMVCHTHLALACMTSHCLLGLSDMIFLPTGSLSFGSAPFALVLEWCFFFGF